MVFSLYKWNTLELLSSEIDSILPFTRHRYIHCVQFLPNYGQIMAVAEVYGVTFPPF